MTDPVFHADSDLLRDLTAGEDLEVTGPEARHAVTVRRFRPGEVLDLVDGAGTRLRCEFLQGAKDRMALRVQEVCEQYLPHPRLTLVQALAKGDRDLQAVESATELGVARVLLWQAERSVVRVKADRVERTLAKWQAAITSAAKQSRRAVWPHLEGPFTSASLVEHVREHPEVTWLVLHERATTPWSSHPVTAPRPAGTDPAGEVAVIVGPEGGISDHEVDALQDAGAHVALLGSTVLRSSTAGPAALAALSAAHGLWDRGISPRSP